MDIHQIRTLRCLTLLLTVVGAMLFAFSAMVLAQQEERTSPAASESGTPPETPTAEIPDNYIVVLKDDDAGQDPEQVTNARARRGGQDPNQVADDQARRHGLRVRHVYQDAIKGYSAVIPEGELQEVEDDPRVAFVEPDKEVRATRKKKNKKKRQNLPWGINRIDADVSSTKAGDGSGAVSDVNAYIIDTGLSNHEDLNVTARAAFNEFEAKDYDCDGHGTHVAGTVAAKDNRRDVVSPAPGVPLTGVKVLNCNGSGTTSGVIAGVDWVTTNAKKPALANMSLGGGASQALDKAVRRSAANGVFYSIAAGNDGDDACDKSPARAGKGSADPTTGELIDANERDNGIMTVAATNNNDAEASFSNYGDCVDIWAPGVDVSSTAMGGGTTKMSGTSMASPHVGGTAALYLSQNAGVSVAEIERRLKDDSVDTGTQSKDREGTLIKRLYAGSY